LWLFLDLLWKLSVKPRRLVPCARRHVEKHLPDRVLVEAADNG
jgi:hypothetical protein